MANLRDIRNRIESVQNTMQITKAMKMVAAAKLRKAQNRIIDTRPYAYKMKQVVSRLVANAGGDNVLMRRPEQIDRVLFIVIGSDRGLCGGFNNNLFKAVEKRIADDFAAYNDSGNLSVIALGKKADKYFRKRKYKVAKSIPGFFDELEFASTSEVMREVIGLFKQGSFDQVHLCYNEFKSVISQNRIVEPVLPIDPELLLEDRASRDLKGEYIYEPDAEAILDKLLPLHLNMQIWKAVLESNAAEQGARMTAMDNATENAKDIERDLKLDYNQARQSAITTEISEIVSGAQALKES
ncbi:MAG: ATP synthase F1 subunit gamma [Balneolaceae bacterium]|nr:ATP synthase F1 subunit gamma [Balneolaceae bacterium]